MSRLLVTKGLYELFRYSHFVASCVSKRKVVNLLPACSASHHKLNFYGRHLNTGASLWKDALQPKADKAEEMDTIDLEKWKSVMRSQASSEDKVKQTVSNGEDESDTETGAVLGDSSSLEATREMVTMWREAGKLVPQEMTDAEVQILAEYTTKSSRKKYLKHLAIKEGYRKARKEKQKKNKVEKEAFKEKRALENLTLSQDELRALELKRTFVIQLWDRSLDRFLGWGCAQAMLFGQPLVFDMSYDSNMSRRELENTVNQLMEAEGWNRRSPDPFHIHFCNLQAKGAYEQELLKRYGAEAWDRLLITSTESKHVEMFPSDQLVYLTADSPNILRKFDHSKVYIIGSLVDRSIQSGLSLANAKRLKLATARLPLDELLHWDMGAKNLTLDQMIRIMLTIKDTGKWEEALKFVPKRKHDGFHQDSNNKMTDNAIRRVTNQGQRLDADRLQRPGQRAFTNDVGKFQQSQKESQFSQPAKFKVRSSFKANMEARKGAGKNKIWWNEE